MQIYTITLNPAYDIHANALSFQEGCENLAEITSRLAGGKGVNISRALRADGTDNTAVVVLGKDNADAFKQDLMQAGVDVRFLARPGRIRENLTLHCTDKPETRISFTGFALDDEILQDVLDVLTVDAQTIVTFSGRIATGMSVEKVKGFLLELKKRGAKLVLDSKSLSVEDIKDIKPWLIKPNQEELSDYANCSVKTLKEALEQAKRYFANQAECVMVSMGEQGALLLADGKAYMAVPPKVQAVSTVGAGDSTIAGFLAAYSMGRTPKLCLKRAVACGTAACLTEGTLPPQIADIEAIYLQTKVYECD